LLATHQVELPIDFAAAGTSRRTWSAARDLGPPGHVIGIARGDLVPARAIARARLAFDTAARTAPAPSVRALGPETEDSV
jgi:hypothetical protein